MSAMRARPPTGVSARSRSVLRQVVTDYSRLLMVTPGSFLARFSGDKTVAELLNWLDMPDERPRRRRAAR